MQDSVTLDTSFLVNLKRLGFIQYLCNVFSVVIISPEIWKESYQFQDLLEKLSCLKVVELTSEEKKEVDRLHDYFTGHYSGKHYGEIEALVLTRSRGYFLIISDNLAPWFIRKKFIEYSKVKIFRGTFYFSRLIELWIVKTEYLDKLEGTYSKKDIKRMKKRFE